VLRFNCEANVQGYFLIQKFFSLKFSFKAIFFSIETNVVLQKDTFPSINTEGGVFGKCFYFCIKFRTMKSFESWAIEELELTFGLKKVDNHPVLTAWT
jgi:hypothetical protein